MSLTMQLTPMEDQIMQVISHAGIRHGDWFWPSDISHFGQELFGEGWGGRGRTSFAFAGHRRGGSMTQYPLINCFLGRLAKKGLLWRESSVEARQRGRSWGVWLLTDEGLSFLGIAP